MNILNNKQNKIIESAFQQATINFANLKALEQAAKKENNQKIITKIKVKNLKIKT